MKIFKSKQQEPTHSRIVHKELKEEINSTDASLIIKHQNTAQKIASMDFKSLLKGTRIASFLGGMKADYQRLIDKVDQTLTGALSAFQSNQDISNARVVVNNLGRRIKETEDKLALLKGKFNEKSDELVAKVTNWTRKIVWVLYFLAGFELVANFQVYQLLGGGALSAIAISLISALAIFWHGHITPKYVILLGQGKWQLQLLVFLIFAAPIFIIFLLFSRMRIQSLVLANPEMAEVFVSSPMVPTLIAFFGYLISCYLVYVYRPSKDEMDAYKKYKMDLKAINETSSERELLIRERNDQVPQLQKKLTDHYNFLLLAQQLEQDVSTRYSGCFQEFRSELYLRTNSACDVLFSEEDTDLPMLKLKYQTIDKTQFELCENFI
jgi:hypothetical protein